MNADRSPGLRAAKRPNKAHPGIPEESQDSPGERALVERQVPH